MPNNTADSPSKLWITTEIVIAGICLIALIVAWLFQGMGYQACKFCLFQQIAYGSIFLSILTLGVFKAPKYLRKWVVGLLIFSGVGISGYHGLIQAGLVMDPCKVPKVSSKKDFQSLIFGVNQMTPCSQIPWKILGIPPSFINFIVFLGMLGLTISRRKQISYEKLNPKFLSSRKRD